MSIVCGLHLSSRIATFKYHRHGTHFKCQESRTIFAGNRVYNPLFVARNFNFVRFRPLLAWRMTFEVSKIQSILVTWTRSNYPQKVFPVVIKIAPAVGIVVFALWGIGPLLRWGRGLVIHKNDGWKKGRIYLVLTCYLQPLLLWTSAMLLCRALDPVMMPSEASQVVKQRLLNFVGSLSTVLAFAYFLSSAIQHGQSFFMDAKDPNNARNIGFDFAAKALYSAVWVAAASLFIELLGFSAQKWLTAGGVGTVLLTLAGREIVTNFLSSAMIHATRPFVVNEWIRTKIEGSEVSGIVEHVGWWSPTVVRGEDREAVYIPNHKFTVNVVRNLSQKTHWRIKSHLSISHLDASKINNIVADMRKVLAKNPQVEQQRLHRRVFLENINPENQALVIMVSCFVKTSHFEEYLCVKEAILLDLLRVIRHHRARLATPIRTVQRMPHEIELGHMPFSDSVSSRAKASNRPFLLIEPPYRVSSDDKAKGRPAHSNCEPVQQPLHGAKKDQKDGASTMHGMDKVTNVKVPSGDGNVSLQQQKESVLESGVVFMNPEEASSVVVPKNLGEKK